VNIPLIYGEGVKAFRRLQEEIIKRCNDLTIFAWEMPSGKGREILSPLSASPAAFAACNDIGRYTGDFAQFSITNKGLLLSSDIAIRTLRIDNADGLLMRLYLVCLGTGRSGVRGIYLRKIDPNLFCREGSALVSFDNLDLEPRKHESNETCILLETQPVISAALASRSQCIHVPLHASFDLRHTHPEMLGMRPIACFCAQTVVVGRTIRWFSS